MQRDRDLEARGFFRNRGRVLRMEQMLLGLGEEEGAGKTAQGEICLFPDIFYKWTHTVNVFCDFFFTKPHVVKVHPCFLFFFFFF